jgi:hypothetical protein
MNKNKKKNLKKIVKKIKNEAAKNALSAIEVHAVVPPVDAKTEAAKVKVKIKKTKKLKGELPDGKKEEAGKEDKKEPSRLPGGIEKAGGDEGVGGLNDPNWWPWERS